LNVRSLSNKAGQVNEYIVDNKIDIMALTETWLLPGDINGSVITEATPRGYELRHMPRGGRGGGVGIIFKKSLKCKLIPPKKFTSF
jgi:exonuclease III